MCQEERLRAGELGERKMRIAGEKIHEGERIVFTKKDRALGLENGFMGEVVSIDEAARNLTVRLDKGGREVAIPVEKYGAEHIRLGYCGTVHKSQGSTRETVHVLLGGHMMDKHLSYVAASRSRGATHLVCDSSGVGKDPTLRDAVGTLARAMSKDRTKDLATDLLDRSRSEPVIQTQERPLQQERSYGI